MQLLADAVKFLTKQDFMPARGYGFIYYAAPVVAMIPATLALNALPLSVPVNVEAFQMLGQTWGPYVFKFQGYDFGIGIVFVLGVSSLAAYALLLAGYGSNNKYSMYGALRACAQTISYELAMGLSIVGVILLFNTFSFTEIVNAQSAPFSFSFLGQKYQPLTWLPAWGIFYQPLGALILFAAMFAEANRLPFDLPEAEGELVAGYHTEYSGFKFNMFFIGEYGHMLVASVLMVIFFFGGYTIYPWLTPETVGQWFAGMPATQASLLTALVLHVVLMAKVVVFLWIFIHVRWTLPRFRYDQLMDLGWRTMLPWALFNTVVTAVVILIARQNWGG
jgi:NADH-quinone oxidoreductase subunit H